ncbi:penicillin acylase family protein [Jatrophihabitans endophyticus]|uniref:penicillin acylase family protein n=1 Tax=Jatrophihabitans endophyticus TaxID=1206085 RepID=UPI0019DBA07D|nr:penicillin acylase family protein [Jatrophihabitans endophyticus]MBE7188407.1 penicillin acylase family protein [Jatrophihabitans endophyticus]
MSPRAVRSRVRLVSVSLAGLTALALVVSVGVPSGTAAPTASEPSHAYRAHDYAGGQAMSILPPGENGLVNATDLLKFEANGTRPAGSQDQLGKYENLLYGYPKLTDSTLHDYYDDESFGVKKADIVRTEKPESGVTIYRDQHDVPHVYGTSDETMSFGAGYAQAEDRLFLMDVLRHYGEGTLASFLGGSCEFEQMDHDQLLLSPYTKSQAVAQVDALPKEYGAQGELAKKVIYAYVRGINAYVTATQTDPNLLPADYLAAAPSLVPQKWSVADVVAIAGLIGGIFGRGGGSEIANAHLLQYLQQKLGTSAGAKAFAQFKDSNDPLAPTTADRRFRYEIPGRINPKTTALPDYDAPVTGGPTDTAADCDLTPSNPLALSIIKGLSQMPKHMSNALVVNANHSADGHPIAVFGPQVSYYTPQILAEEDLHSPDYDAEGASFPGTGIVELGRGEDYAWSATSAGSDLIDQRLEKICNPNGGAPEANGTDYLYKGTCVAMKTEEFDETALPKAGGVGGPAQLDHTIHLTRHGVVQGWTTAHGRPVAIVTQRSTFRHDVDSVVGFLDWGRPNLTHDAKSWMVGAHHIEFTFNWLYVDNRDTGYYVSGRDPVRPSDVNPDLPTWGTGNAEWKGFLPASRHVHEINPKTGYFVSWNNKPAPGFAAADDQYGYGQVYRSIMLTAQLKHQLAIHHGKLQRADVVKAMETAASQDLDGVSVLPLLLRYVKGRSEPAGVQKMLGQLRTWVAAGAHRRKAAPSDTQYQHAAAVAISDELMPLLIEALYDPILKAGGLGSQGSNGGATSPSYSALPMQFVNTPNSGGAHLGSAYDGGYESYLVSTLQQLLGKHPADGFGPEITSRECRGGPSTCHKAIDAALESAYTSLVTANGSSKVASWTASTASKAAGQTMPVYDAIQFRALGVVTQPAIDWQNRPTFQQVIEFPRHRKR